MDAPISLMFCCVCLHRMSLATTQKLRSCCVRMGRLYLVPSTSLCPASTHWSTRPWRTPWWRSRCMKMPGKHMSYIYHSFHQTVWIDSLNEDDKMRCRQNYYGVGSSSTKQSYFMGWQIRWSSLGELQLCRSADLVWLSWAVPQLNTSPTPHFDIITMMSVFLTKTIIGLWGVLGPF